MRNVKRPVAFILAAAMAFGNCGSIMATAAENVRMENAAETEAAMPGNDGETAPVAERDEAIPGEPTSGSDDTSGNEREEVQEKEETDGTQENEKTQKTEETQENEETQETEETQEKEEIQEIEETQGKEEAQETEEAQKKEETDGDEGAKTGLPALQIGQIKKGETLPSPGDSEFIYDLPVSFEMADSLILFTNYDIDAVYAEGEGTLSWSILRGEEGMAEGSTNLLNEEDDWIGFEVVTDAPYFIMTENDEEESGYYKMMELLPEERENFEEPENPNGYHYYIRASYDTATGENNLETPYAIATIPFKPYDNADTVQNDDDPADEGESADEGLSDRETDMDEASEAVDLNNSDGDGAEEADSVGNLEEDKAVEEALEADGSESAETDRATGEASTISENDLPPAQEDQESQLILSETNITMKPGEMKQITAKLVPEDSAAKIVWSSSDKTVAVAGSDGEITAKAEGKARITATCGDITAAASVEVARDETGKLLDLSGDIWVAGFEKENEQFVYTGQKITQDIRVYYKDTLLKEKTDYTLTYKNNVNAAAWNSLKAPSVTITLKGQYSGSVTLHYTIKPAAIEAANIYNTKNGSKDELADSIGSDTGTGGSDTGTAQSSGCIQAVNYSKTLKIPNPELTFGKAKLKINKDFVCDYVTVPEGDTGFVPMPAEYKNGDAYEPGKVYNYIVNGIGNFAGSFKMQLVVLKDKTLNFSAAAVTLDQKQYAYRGVPLSKTDVRISSLTLNKTELAANLYDYEVRAENLTGAYVMVYPSAVGRNKGYCGYKKVNLKLAGDRNIKDAALGQQWRDTFLFSQKTINEEGGIFQEKTGVLTYGTGAAAETLTEGQDYTVKYGNAKKAGKVTVTFTGIGRYKGTLKKQYQIMPNENSGNFRLVWGKNVERVGGTLTVAYQKGGAAPEFVLKDQDNHILTNKTDYTVKYKNNTVPGENMTCEITGKGNYKGYSNTVELQVTAGRIDKATISVPDKPYSAKADAWKSKVTVKDVNGKTLAAGKDYDKNHIIYSYDGMENGEPPKAGTTVKVTVRGIGCYEGSVNESGSYRIYENSISKLKVAIDAQEYTGEAVTLVPYWEESWETGWKHDIHVYQNASDQKNKVNEVACKEGEYYEIVGYTNNIKAGTAKVTLRGLGDYGGTKTYSFKIQKKTYRINHVKKITLNQTNLSVRLAEKKMQLTATITPEEEWEKIANPTIIWSTSNSKIAEVGEIDKDPDNEKVAIATVDFKKEGTVTITATAQDGSKKAQCKLTIVNVPIFEQAGQKIEGKVGSTYQLTVKWDETQEEDPNKLKWESNNTDRITVNKDGLVTFHKVGAAIITLRVGSSSYVQQCTVIANGEEEEVLPDGNALIYEQQPGTTDDTKAINSLLRQWEWNPTRYDYMYLPAGVYRIDATPTKNDFGGIILTDNQKLIMSPGTLLVANASSSGSYHIIWAFGRDNITISGGQIIGERKNHKGSGGEHGHGIQISGCTNVTIQDVEISQCWGDGIYVGFYDGPNKYSNGVTIQNCILRNNRRNNLSITDASNVTVSDCEFYDAKGTAPQYGIDIEPNENRTCSNITISRSKFRGNAGGTIQILGQLNAHVKGVTIENCTGDKAPVIWQGFGGSVSGVTQRGNTW